MAKSAKRDKSEGMLDRVGGRILEFFGALTGRKKHKAKGKAARARGHFRGAKGGAKSRAR